MKLEMDFYQRADVVEIANDLLGKVVCTEVNGIFTSGRIVETEAYCGQSDRACHAFGGKRTPRTEIMFGPGGRAYVYLCYGVHHLLNFVTNEAGKADAVLIRALEPLEGFAHMLQRRGMEKIETRLTSGPGALSRALGVNVSNHNGLALNGSQLWVDDDSTHFEIECGKRIGVEYAGEDALLPWRFWVKNNPWVSKVRS